ncbi:MAG: diacylglycerol kinase family lipid kinase [Actinobacteria bacterium]|nr:diacylglycerol kinase family lipid kinase [Actinomycetota bacterium]
MSKPSLLAIINPVSRHGKGKEDSLSVIPKLKESFAVDIVESEGKGHIEKISLESKGFDVLLICGGDGSVHEAVNGVMKRKDEKPILAYLPVGSGNDSARSCGIPFNLKKAVSVITSFKTAKVDVGRMNNIYYSNSLGIGLDGLVAEKAYELRNVTRLKGVPLYLKSLQLVLKDWQSFTLRFESEGKLVYEKPSMLAAINIGRSYGGGFFVTPDAFIDDGLLDICIVEEIPNYQVPIRLPFFIIGKYKWMKVAHTLRAKSVKVEASREVFVQLDGETYRVKDADIQVIDKALEVVVSDKAFLRSKK